MMNVESSIRRITINDENIEVEVVTSKPNLPSILLNFASEDTLIQQIFNIMLIEVKEPKAAYQLQSYLDSGNGTVNGALEISAALGLKIVSLVNVEEKEIYENVENQIYRAVFDYEDLPKDLSFVLLTYFDFAPLEIAFKVNVPDIIKNDYISHSLYNVVNNTVVVDTFYSFTDTNGEYYTGPVEYSDGKYYKFNTKEFLNAEEEFNDIIADRRPSKEIFELENYLEGFEKNLVYHPIVKEYEKPKVYGSGLMTTDEENVVRGAFTIDLYNILKDNSRFSDTLYRKNTEYDSIKESMIKLVTVYRQRVTPVNVLNSLGTLQKKWDSQDFPLEKVCSGNDTSQMFFPKVTKLDEKGEEIATLRAVKNYTFYRQFVFSDNLMKNISDGHYKYIVELTILDGTLEKLQKDIMVLDELYSQFISFRREMESFSNRRDFYDSRVKKGSFDWNKYSIELMNIVSIYFDIKNPKIIEDTIKLIHPLTASEDSIYEFETMFNLMLEKLTSMNSEARYSDDITVSFEINNVIDSNRMRNSGIDYLYDFSQEGFKYTTSGLAVLDAAYYISRVNTEMDSYLEQKESTEQLTAYLTPSRVLSKKQVHSLKNPEAYKSARKAITTQPNIRITQHSTNIKKELTENKSFGISNKKEAINDSPDKDLTDQSSILKFKTKKETQTKATRTVYDNVKKMNKPEFIAENIFPTDKMPYQLSSLRRAVDGDLNIKVNSIVNPANKEFKGIDKSNQDEYKFNYELINKIEYLEGYLEDNINQPNWKLLTLAEFNQLKGETICRLSPIDYPFINLNGREEFSEMPTINKYFLLKSKLKIDNIEVDYKNRYSEYVNGRDRKNTTVKKNNGIYRFK